MKKNVLSLFDIYKIFKLDGISVEALKKINLEIRDGEFISITGPSGSGKSTLMHIMGCLDKPSEGKIFLDGKEISKYNNNQLAQIRNQTIGFVFQSFSLLPRTTAIANVEIPLIYAGFSAKKRFQIAKDKLSQLGLQDRLYHHPNQLSGGQQQRVAIARALVNNPKIILADEPTGNLDSKSGKEIIKILHYLHHKKHTIILVTHDLDLAREAEREIRLIDGEIVFDK